MTLNQMFDFTPVYIYIVAAVQLFIGFSLSFAIGQILPLRIREFMYYLFSFLFLFIPFLYEIATANVQSGMRSFLFYLALLITIFLFTKESFLKKLSLFFILVFFDGILGLLFVLFTGKESAKNYSVFTIPRILMFLIKKYLLYLFSFYLLPLPK